ncbi:MAG: NADH-quinone oxidoreductase subunit J, partial [candidate division Zixibacteria bacterium]|nr:NADH-quinone oxidoreductase subunit J [candidate division Zixibacteria bacterium]
MLTGVPEAIFYILAATIIGSAVMVVSLKNIFHSALFLVLCFFSVAGIYILLDAEFLAAVQILIYVGAITVLIIFAIMLTHKLYSAKIRQSNEQVIPGLIIVGTLLVATLFALSK